MCRIAGIIDTHFTDLATDISRMNDAMYRGGPDGVGIYIDDKYPLALGHRRLALLDLSAAGHQPMSSSNGDIQLVFNGEIYNFLELRKELTTLGHLFQTRTDTEVIIAAYLQWGIDCFNRFNGMFAIAIWDKRKQQLLLVRDYAGIKPLYYSLEKGKLIFASEIRAFKAYNPYWPEREDWKIPFLCFGHIPEPLTTLSNVQPVPKGHVIAFQLPSLKYSTRRFEKFTFEPLITDFNEAKIAVRTTLEKAVARHLIADASVGLFLSGGIDSSILTLIAAKVAPPNSIKTLSLVFDEAAFSEAPYQAMITQQTGIPHQSFRVTESIFHEAIPDIVAAMDQPSTDGINAYFICKYAHEYGLKAVLSGIGSDELMGGYPSFRRTPTAKKIQKLPNFLLSSITGILPDKFKRIAALTRKDGIGLYLFNRGYFTPQQTAELLGCSTKKVQEVLDIITQPSLKSSNADQNTSLSLEIDFYLQNQLLKDNDYMSMWHSLELRVPFLDKEFIQLAHIIDSNIKVKNNIGKYLLIEAFNDCLPEAIWKRPKQGFAFPFYRWMQQLYPLKRNKKLQSIGMQFMKNKLHWSKYWCYLLLNKEKNLVFHQQQLPTILFANLTAFSVTGGIEKFNRSFLKALFELEIAEQLVANAYSAYDTLPDETYFPHENYRGFSKKRLAFVKSVVKDAQYYQHIVIGHINMAIIILLIRFFYKDRKKITLITHGIEVWGKLSWLQKWAIHSVNECWTVSSFTKDKLIDIQKMSENKIKLFYNTIDPFFAYPTDFQKPSYLLSRYHLSKNQPILFTLTRLKSSEKYKGYDKVIAAVALLKEKYPTIQYLIAGKTDNAEANRINELITFHNVSKHVKLIGFIDDLEVTDHYLLADVFVMPSKKEG
ncbi:MAG: asparagine synthase (glutamine-hydrolyzing), partial [Chitinophagaceae bacterium]